MERRLLRCGRRALDHYSAEESWARQHRYKLNRPAAQLLSCRDSQVTIPAFSPVPRGSAASAVTCATGISSSHSMIRIVCRWRTGCALPCNRDAGAAFSPFAPSTAGHKHRVPPVASAAINEQQQTDTECYGQGWQPLKLVWRWFFVSFCWFLFLLFALSIAASQCRSPSVNVNERQQTVYIVRSAFAATALLIESARKLRAITSIATPRCGGRRP
jgi:hypothetical protein